MREELREGSRNGEGQREGEREITERATLDTAETGVRGADGARVEGH